MTEYIVYRLGRRAPPVYRGEDPWSAISAVARAINDGDSVDVTRLQEHGLHRFAAVLLRTAAYVVLGATATAAIGLDHLDALVITVCIAHVLRSSEVIR